MLITLLGMVILTPIQLPKSLHLSTVLYRYLHMYCRLTHPKLFRSLSYGRVVLNNIHGNVDCSFFNIILQCTLAKCVFYIVCEGVDDNSYFYNSTNISTFLGNLIIILIQIKLFFYIILCTKLLNNQYLNNI